MPCAEAPSPSAPTLPGPFTFGAGISPQSFDPSLCCKQLPFPIASPPLPLPAGALNPAFLAALNEGVAQVVGVLRGLAIRCPRE